MEKKKQDIEQLLAEGTAIQIKPNGYSMYPLFVPGRDEAVIAPVNSKKLKRGDVVLYRREGSILVLHRIWKKQGNTYYMVGDNQREIEGPLQEQQIKGILVEIVRKNRHISTENILYRLLSGIWLCMRPFRPCISRILHRGKKLFEGRKSEVERKNDVC